MREFNFAKTVSRVAVAGAAAGVSLLLSGCAIQPVSETSVNEFSLSGNLHGGEQPIGGATIRLYATASTGVATNGVYVPATPLTALGTATTSSTGSFTFTPSVSCSAPAYVYAVASGGSAAGNTAANPNTVLMSAVGPCSSLTSSTFININEVTTVAAAFALSGFTSISGSAVSVTSSATNYAGASGVGTTASAAGLVHAFQNANNLITPTVSAQTNTALPGNSAAIVPAALINALGNSLQACVNSLGGVAGDNSTCGNLFTYTTPSGGTAPTNTLQAALNIARNPTQNVASIYALGSPQAAFQPALTSAPADWSVAIAYPKYDGVTNGDVADKGTNGLFYPYGLTLDANDNVYVMNADASSTTQSNVLAFSSNGSPLWATVVDTTNSTPRFIATDGLSHVFLVNNGSTLGAGGNANIVEYNATNGAVVQTLNTAAALPWGIAIDSSNNIWYSIALATATQNLYSLTYAGGTTYNAVTFGTTPADTAAGQSAYQLVIDPSNNIWASNYISTSGKFSQPLVLPYTAATTGPPAVPAYNAAEVNTTVASGVSGYGMAVDSSGNGWITNSAGFYKITKSGSGSTLSLTAGTLIPYTATGGTGSLRYLTIDGNNTLWSEDNNTTNSVLAGYSTLTGTQFKLKPCIIVTAAACPTLSSSTPGIYGPRISQVDASGSIWVASSTNGEIVQVIGAAAPTWPLIAVTKPGLMP